MAVISSIKHLNITNEYNEGANYFRRFLHYAESVSNGNMQVARVILDSLVVNKNQHIATVSNSIVIKQIKERLQKQGYEVAEHVGQSDFKCSLAVKMNPGDEEYTMSILLDDDRHYSNYNLVEQYYQRPAILRSFGWRTLHVFSKDWLQNPDRVMENVIRCINEVPAGEAESEEPVSSEVAAVEEVKAIEQEIQVPELQAQSLPGFDNLVFERVVFADAVSNKFWEAAVQENKLIVRFGKIGAKGQVQLKTFEHQEKAVKEMEKLLAEKLAKGYKRP